MWVLLRLLKMLGRDASMDRCRNSGKHTGLNAKYCSDCIETGNSCDDRKD